ncbi:hypothetical protein BDW02DRAFT_573435 [Decorospora gaudefroyi]|uniref:Uncharacterized protein n=1 Tax=Decorospora gaudefroyi TaxID=184978 RepID=A0A6A5JZN5_9PLEO|nr:hypothetical protein BDW02DRAFT_573435 [Decorospora gaudefroyi]
MASVSSSALPLSSSIATTTTLLSGFPPYSTVTASMDSLAPPPAPAPSSIIPSILSSSPALSLPSTTSTLLPRSSSAPSPSSLAATTTQSASAAWPPNFWNAASFLKGWANESPYTAPNTPVYSGLTSYSGNPLQGRTTLSLTTPPAHTAIPTTSSIMTSAAQASSTAIVVEPITPSTPAIVIVPVSPQIPPRATDDVPSFVLVSQARHTPIADTTTTSTTTIETTITKPLPKPSATPTADPSVYTSVLTPDERCPYPYPGIYCGKPKTTLVTKTTKKATPTTSAGCGYPGQPLLC